MDKKMIGLTENILRLIAKIMKKFLKGTIKIWKLIVQEMKRPRTIRRISKTLEAGGIGLRLKLKIITVIREKIG